MENFRIRCSQIGKIMGEIGLTESQKIRLNELETRHNNSSQKPLTEKMRAELKELQFKFNNPELPQTCKSYLHEWYANDNEQIHSKYTDKGNEVESDLIDFMADVLGYGIAEKNHVRLHDEYFEGECDVNLPSCIIDVKASWNRKTLQEQVIKGIDPDYKWQLLGYCHLYKKPLGILFFGLMNTPENDYNPEIVYEDMSINERWIAYKVEFNQELINQIIERVKMCREYLTEYDKIIKSNLGKLH